MIDVHNHLLPGIDDGARTIEETLNMARVAVEDGIDTIVATPHCYDGIYNNDVETILSLTEQVQIELDRAQIPLRVVPGGEIRLHAELIEHMLTNQLSTMAGLNHAVLLEFPAQQVPIAAESIVFELRVRGITPIIAHPERNAAIMQNPTILYHLVKEGALAQATATAVTGRLGRRAKELTERLMQHGLIHLIASDAHDAMRRAPRLSEADTILRTIAPHIATSWQVTAAAIVKGEAPLAPFKPEHAQKKKRFFFF